jgi:hypothetical protein
MRATYMELNLSGVASNAASIRPIPTPMILSARSIQLGTAVAQSLPRRLDHARAKGWQRGAIRQVFHIDRLLPVVRWGYSEWA